MRRILATAVLALWMFASPASAQWTPDTTVVLKGKVVTMTGQAAKPGQVHIKNGVIVAIKTASAAIPPGAIVIDTRGYIYPGLMDLHNHLEYNFVPLYSVPKHSENHDDWPSGKAYDVGVNNPWKVATDANIYNRSDEAFKFAEVRAMIGGATTSQGADNNPAISKTLVRNVELENFGVDAVGQRSFTIDKLFWEHLAEQRDRIKAQVAWINHCAEGIDEYARKEFDNPAYDPSKPFHMKTNRPGLVQADLVWPGLVGVHCTALTEDDFKKWKSITGGPPKIVWSPVSNILLYGKTTDVAAAKRQGALIALGTDWAPSGTKNMLWELKAVDRLNKTKLNNLFTEQQILEMATVNAAKMVGWEKKVGKLEVGMVADILVVDDMRPAQGGGYRNLLMAIEQNVQLVMVGGNPLYGDEAHLKRLKVYDNKPRYELLPETAGARPKGIDMKEDTTVRNGDMTFAQVRKNLQDALDLRPADLAAILNAGVKESATRTTYKGREYVKAQLVTLLTAKNLPVPASLRDPNAAITAEQAGQFLSLKYKNHLPGGKVETLFTDAAFLDRLEANLHWKEPYNAGIDLRSYLPPSVGMVNAVPGQ